MHNNVRLENNNWWVASLVSRMQNAKIGLTKTTENGNWLERNVRKRFQSL